MSADHPGPPEVEIVEASAERLGDVASLWRAMHEYHAEVAGEAREVTPIRRAEDSWRRRRADFERWMGAGNAWLLIAGNEDALRFYERWGMAPSHVRCLGRTLPGGGSQ